jgi:hypothetical protein
VSPITQLKRHAGELIDRYFAGAASPTDLQVWASAHPTFANPKALDNNDDWILGNALALMIALDDTSTDRVVMEERLREARRFLNGEIPFPEDRWPAGLLR